jgi:hypothetical protein
LTPQHQPADRADQQAQRAGDDRQDEEGADPLRVVFSGNVTKAIKGKDTAQMGELFDMRFGSMCRVGLQIRSGIPRELGGALIALLPVFTAMHKFYRVNGQGHGEGRNTN